MSNPWDKQDKKQPLPPPQQKVEEAVEEKPQKKESDTRESTPQILVSHTDAYIWDRMKSQPKSLKDIDVQVVTERQPGLHRLSLPKELLSYEKNYTFRWIYKTKRAIDDACDVKGWVLVNRTHFEDLPSYLFTANGSIERGDNILAFMSKKKAEELRKLPIERSKQMLNSTLEKHKGDPRYYVPKDDETDQVIGI